MFILQEGQPISVYNALTLMHQQAMFGIAGLMPNITFANASFPNEDVNYAHGSASVAV